MWHRYMPIIQALKARRCGDKWHGRCPVCGPDRRACLGLWLGSDGALCCRCHRESCKWREIVRASGTSPQDWFPEKGSAVVEAAKNGQIKRRIVKTYDYQDAQGSLVYQVVRFEPKDFAVRRPSGDGQWEWSLGEDTQPLPYQLPLIKRSGPKIPILIVKGEKDADAINELSGKFIATCNHGGAGKWSRDLDMWFYKRRVIIIPDADEPGFAHAVKVAGHMLFAGTSSVQITHVLRGEGQRPNKDVSDYLLQYDNREKKTEALIQMVKLSTVETWVPKELE